MRSPLVLFSHRLVLSTLLVAGLTLTGCTSDSGGGHIVAPPSSGDPNKGGKIDDGRYGADATGSLDDTLNSASSATDGGAAPWVDGIGSVYHDVHGWSDGGYDYDGGGWSDGGYDYDGGGWSDGYYYGDGYYDEDGYYYDDVYYDDVYYGDGYYYDVDYNDSYNYGDGYYDDVYNYGDTYYGDTYYDDVYNYGDGYYGDTYYDDVYYGDAYWDVPPSQCGPYSVWYDETTSCATATLIADPPIEPSACMLIEGTEVSEASKLVFTRLDAGCTGMPVGGTTFEVSTQNTFIFASSSHGYIEGDSLLTGVPPSVTVTVELWHYDYVDVVWHVVFTAWDEELEVAAFWVE